MTHNEALSFIKKGIESPNETWVDLGAGSGTFSYALAELLGTNGVVYAIDQEKHNLAPLKGGANIISVQHDFNLPLKIGQFDGILMANSLHYVEDKKSFLKRQFVNLREGGTFLLIEYDTEIGNPWVPYPISLERFRELADEIGLQNPTLVGRRNSRYGNGGMYAIKYEWGSAIKKQEPS